jgi:hypothetical protein
VRPRSASWRSNPRSQWTPPGVQPVAGFVQDQHLGVAEQGSGQAQALTHAEREAADPPAGRLGEADLVEDLVGAVEGQTGGGGDDPQVVAGAAAGMEAGGLQERADVADGIGQLPVGSAVDPGGPGGRGDQAEQRAQGGGLAGPVGAEEPDHGALVDLEAEVVDGGDRSEALGESLDGDDGHGLLLRPVGLLSEADQRRGAGHLDGRRRGRRCRRLPADSYASAASCMSGAQVYFWTGPGSFGSPVGYRLSQYRV